MLQRYAGPAKPTPMVPAQDPRFRELTSKLGKTGGDLKHHPPPKAEAKKAADAAVPPAQNKEAQAKAAQAETMSGAKPGGFDKAAFIAQVKQAIAAKSPKSLDEAESFGDSGKAGEVKAEVAGKVAEGKDTAAKDIADKTGAAPDQGKAVDKAVKPLPPEKEPAPPTIDAASAMPAKAPPEQTDLSGGKVATDGAMKEAGVNERQLATSNEPEFAGALADKKAGEAHSAQAPQQFRASEAEKLAEVKQQATGDTRSGIVAMLGSKKSMLTKGAAQKSAAKAKDEQERARITKEIQSIFDTTKTAVTGILDTLDAEVGKRFDAGEKAARDAFTADHKRRMDAYKDERYSGITGAARWLRDKFASLPPEANNVYVEAKKVYEAKMEVCISDRRRLHRRAAHPGEGQDRRRAHEDQGLRRPAAQEPPEARRQHGRQVQRAVRPARERRGQQEGRPGRGPGHQVRRVTQGRRRRDRGAAGGEQGPVGQGDRCDRRASSRRSSSSRTCCSAYSPGPRTRSSKIIKDPIGFLGNFVNAVKTGITNFASNILEHLKAGPEGLALRRAARAPASSSRRSSTCKGIIQLVLSHPRHDLGEHQGADRSSTSPRASGTRWRRASRSSRSSSRRGSAGSGSGCSRRSATSRTWS